MQRVAPASWVMKSCCHVILLDQHVASRAELAPCQRATSFALRPQLFINTNDGHARRGQSISMKRKDRDSKHCAQQYGRGHDILLRQLEQNQEENVPREGGREVYLLSRLLKRTVLVARAQTALYLAAALFPLSPKSGTDPAPSL